LVNATIGGHDYWYACFANTTTIQYAYELNNPAIGLKYESLSSTRWSAPLTDICFYQAILILMPPV
jgi:hypothetical protein